MSFWFDWLKLPRYSRERADAIMNRPDGRLSYDHAEGWIESAMEEAREKEREETKALKQKMLDKLVKWENQIGHGFIVEVEQFDEFRKELLGLSKE